MQLNELVLKHIPTIAGFAFVLWTFPGFSQETALGELIQSGENTPTVSEITELEQQARSTLESEGCLAASSLLVSVSSGANVMANVLRQGLEPFYDADRDTREHITRNREAYSFDELLEAERVSNQYIRLRNEFLVLEAECLAEVGERQAAIERLYEALNLIGATRVERDVWVRARELLWELVGYPEES